MATQARDVPANSEGTAPPESTSDQLPVEPVVTEATDQNKPAGLTDAASPSAEYVSLLEQQLRAQNQQIQQLVDAQTREPLTREPPPPPRDAEAEKAKFYNDPAGTTQELIRRELDAAIAPLTEFVKGFKATSEYETIKTRFKGDMTKRTLSQYLSDPIVENAVDRIMEQAEKTETNLQGAIIHVLGLRAAGVLEGVSTTPQPSNDPPPRTEGDRVSSNTPAHLRPSAPPLSRTTPPARRELNELERRLARERWPSLKPDEQRDRYLNFLEASPADVVDLDESGKRKA